MKVARLSALRNGCLYPQEMFLVIISVRGWGNPMTIVQQDGLCQWKIPVTPSGIDPATKTCIYLADCLCEGTALVPEILRERVIVAHDNERIGRLNLLYEGQGQIAYKCQGSSQPDCPRYAQQPPGFSVCYTSFLHPIIASDSFPILVPPFSKKPKSHDSNKAPSSRRSAITRILMSHY
jgi:hypothetical protein